MGAGTSLNQQRRRKERQGQRPVRRTTPSFSLEFELAAREGSHSPTAQNASNSQFLKNSAGQPESGGRNASRSGNTSACSRGNPPPPPSEARTQLLVPVTALSSPAAAGVAAGNPTEERSDWTEGGITMDSDRGQPASGDAMESSTPLSFVQQEPDMPDRPSSGGSKASRRARSNLCSSASGRRDSEVDTSQTPNSPSSRHTSSRPSSAASAASSRPSSAASKPPRSPVNIQDPRAPGVLDMSAILQRRISTTSNETSPRGTPRSPVTLLLHNPVARTPRSPLPSGGVALCGVPELPCHYVERHAELAEARSQLLLGHHVVLVGPQGVGGVGKSTLAAALARDPEVQEGYKDGIFWLMLSPKVDPMIRAEELKVTMAMHRLKTPVWVPLEETNTLEAMKDWFRKTLSGRRCVLVVDNCSSPEELQPFLETGLVLLVTANGASSPGNIAESIRGAAQCTVPLAFGELVKRILSAAAGVADVELQEAGRGVLRRYGGLLMELTLIGGALRGQGPSAQAEALDKLAVPEVNLEELYGAAVATSMEAPTMQLLRTLAVALELLPPPILKLYRKMAVLPDGVYTPLHTLQLLWELGSEGQVRDICNQLAARSLLIITNAADGAEHITVHEVQLDFLRHRQRAEVAAWHAALVDAYSADLDHIASVVDDGYIVNNIAHHLKGSHRLDTLRELLYDTDWLERKLHNHGVRAVLDDFRRYLEERRDPQVHTLAKALKMAAPAALVHPALSMLGVQMAARLRAHAHQPLIPDWIAFIRALLDEEVYGNGAVPLWPLSASLGQVAGANLATLAGHTSWVTAAAISPNGSWAVTCSTDRTAAVWCLSTGRRLLSLVGHRDHVGAASISPCGGLLVTASRDRTARVWDAASGVQVAVLPGHKGGVSCCTVATRPTREGGREGIVITGSDDKTARVWRLQDGTELFTLSAHTDKIRSLKATTDGLLLVTGSDDTTGRVWDLLTGECLHVLSLHADKVGGVVLAEDDKSPTTALTLSSDTTARLWDIRNGACLHTLCGHKSAIGGAAVAPLCARAVTVSGDKTARVWDLQTGTCLHVLEGHRNWVNGVFIYANGERAITVSVDCHARIWDLTTARCITTLEGHKSLVADVVVTPDGSKALTISSDMTARLWSLQDGLAAYGCGHEAEVSAIAVLPDGERCVSVGHDGAARLWDCRTAAPCCNGLGVPEGLSSKIMSALGVSGDGGSVVAAAGAEAVVWDLGFLAQQPRILNVLRGHTAPIRSVALSYSGSFAVTAGEDGTGRLWETDSGKCRCVLRGHEAAIVSVMLLGVAVSSSGSGLGHVPGTVSPGGEGETQLAAGKAGTLGFVVTASIDCTARVWNPESGLGVSVLSGHRGELSCCIESPPSSSGVGSEVVTASRDRSLRVWALLPPPSDAGRSRCESRSWGCRLKLLGHNAPVTAAALVPSGSGGSAVRLVSGAEDGTLLVWDLETGTELHAIEAHRGPVRCLGPGVCDEWQRKGHSHPAGSLVLSCGDDACAALWDVATGCQVGLFRGDSPLVSCSLSTAPTHTGLATALAGDRDGRLHFLELPKR